MNVENKEEYWIENKNRVLFLYCTKWGVFFFIFCYLYLLGKFAKITHSIIKLGRQELQRPKVHNGIKVNVAPGAKGSFDLPVCINSPR